jgi:hypothetical protein
MKNDCPFRITGFVDFALHPEFRITREHNVQNLDLLPSSSGGKSPLERANLSH